MRFILAPLVILLGLACMRYNVQLTEFTGQIDFAEKYLGGGLLAGTYTWYRLIGLVFVALGVLWIFGIV
jgi:hypothetical protein